MYIIPDTSVSMSSKNKIKNSRCNWNNIDNFEENVILVMEQWKPIEILNMDKGLGSVMLQAM